MRGSALLFSRRAQHITHAAAGMHYAEVVKIDTIAEHNADIDRIEHCHHCHR